MKGGSPFTLHLVGQVNPEHVVIVPTELRDVVQIHQNLPYPQFYQFITKAVSLKHLFAATRIAD